MDNKELDCEDVDWIEMAQDCLAPILAGVLLGLLFDLEDGSSEFFRNVGMLHRNYTALHFKI
jgi:hypothetical protein